MVVVINQPVRWEGENAIPNVVLKYKKEKNMKKLLLILPLVLCACLMSPSETIRNPECTTITRIQIKQLNKDTSLAVALFEILGGWRTEDVAIKTENLKIWSGDRYDGENIYFSNDLCAILDGTYSYTTVIGGGKTIRKIKFINSQIPNPDYTKWQEERAKKEQESSK